VLQLHCALNHFSHVSGCFSSPEDVHVIIQPVVEELSVTFQLLDITSDGRSDEVASRLLDFCVFITAYRSHRNLNKLLNVLEENVNDTLPWLK